MAVHVTGATGFIGSTPVEELVQPGDETACAVRDTATPARRARSTARPLGAIRNTGVLEVVARGGMVCRPAEVLKRSPLE